MISMGITLRTTGWIPFPTAYLYLMMSVPLLLSSLRFYYTGFNYGRFIVTSDGKRLKIKNYKLTINNE